MKINQKNKITMDTKILLEDLKKDKNKRTQVSLDKLNSILEDHYKFGNKDFCIATIGRISKSRGCVGTVSIRNKSGEHYRRLIEAWAAKAGTNLKKPHAIYSRQREIPSDNKLLEYIDDPALRVLFGQIIAERNQLKRENKVLKQNIEVVVDMRPQRIEPPLKQSDNNREQIEIFPSLSSILSSMEVEALEKAISDSFIFRQGWKVNEKTGRILDQDGRSIYKAGYVNAIKKVLSETVKDDDNGYK